MLTEAGTASFRTGPGHRRRHRCNGGNVDGDDFSDLLMGAPGLDQYSFGLSAAGGLYLVRGTGL